MLLVAVLFLLIFAIAALFVWLADNPATITFQWDVLDPTTIYKPTILEVVLIIGGFFTLLIIVWWILSTAWNSPKIFGRWRKSRRRERGYQALSKGLIAAGSGNVQLARKLTKESDKLLKDEPLVSVLDAQTALLEGNHTNARKRFEAMLEDDDTKLLGLRGLYAEAEKENVPEAAAYFAEEANKNTPGTTWAGTALLKAQTAAGEWEEALGTLKQNKAAGFYDSKEYDRKRAVILTALAMEQEDRAPEDAANNASQAHKLEPSLVPAATVAARIYVRLDKQRKAGKILEKTWTQNPHPELIDAYVHLQSGDSSRERLKRANTFAGKNSDAVEGQTAIAEAAIEAGEFKTARSTLTNILETKPSEAVCLLMADLEEAEHGDKGRVREWLTRAIGAPKDAAWTADGILSENWAPTSPVTGKLDAFEWKVPVEQLGHSVETSDYLMLAAEPIKEEPADIIDLEPVVEVEAKTVEPVEPKEPEGEEKDTASTTEPAAAPVTEPVEPKSPFHQADLDADKDGIIDHRPDDPGIRENEEPKKKGLFF